MRSRELIKKYNAIIIVAVVIIFIYKIFDLSFIGKFINAFTPIIIGGVLAYFLQPIVAIMERWLNKVKPNLENKSHTISSIVVFILFMIVIAILLWLVTPALFQYITNFTENIVNYTKGFENSVREFVSDPGLQKIIIKYEQSLIAAFNNLEHANISTVFGYVTKTGSTLITILLGLIFCPYILIEQNRLLRIFDRIMLLFIPKYNLDLIHEYAYKSHKIFGSFIYGKFIDSLIIGIIALIGLGMLNIRFFPLLALIVLITNMIPYFGPFIGGIPVVFIALITGGLFPALFSMLFIFALQQFDGLILGPKILGDVVGISPFWIILSITVFGNLFGFIGMFLGVPLICIIRMLFEDFCKYQNNKIKLDKSQ